MVQAGSGSLARGTVSGDREQVGALETSLFGTARLKSYITPRSHLPLLLHRVVGEEWKKVFDVHLKFQVWMITQMLTSLTENINKAR